MTRPAEAPRAIFINHEGELRCAWRLLVFFAVFLILAFMITALVSGVGLIVPPFGSLIAGRTTGTPATGVLIRSFVNTITLLLAVVGASWVCARFLERRSLASVGYKLHTGWKRDVGIGLALGAATLALSVGISMAAGAVEFRLRAGGTGLLIANFAALFIFFSLAAAFEELLTRGFAFQALAHNAGPVVAITLTSAAFGVLHLYNPGVTLFATVNTVLAGVWLGFAYWKTRSLWLATALHVSWNVAMMFLFGLPVSGITDYSEMGLLIGKPGSPAWLSGGDYGPEGGAAATVLLLASTFVIWKSGLFNASADMQAALVHGSVLTGSSRDRDVNGGTDPIVQ